MKSKCFIFMMIEMLIFIFTFGCGPKESLDSSILSTTEEQTEEETVTIPDIQTTEDVSDIQATGKVENDLAHEMYLKEIEKKKRVKSYTILTLQNMLFSI